jgi:flavorubredoxin
LREKGIEVGSFFVKDVDKSVVKDYDCMIAGAPTMAFRMSSEMRRFLDGLPSKEFSGKLAVAFDTQIQSRFSGSAVKGIEGRLKDLGFKLVATPLITYVEGKTSEMRLKEGELEKAKKYAEDLVKKLQS